MRILSFLFLFIFFNTSFAYTVILNSGKRVEGAYVAEDQRTLQLCDRSGILISFKKQNLNLHAMSVANQEQPPETLQHPPEPAVPVLNEPDLVEMARTVRLGRTGRSRVYTAESLRNVPEISYSESEIEITSLAKREDRSDEPDETGWRAAARKLKQAIDSIEDKKHSEDAACAAAREKQEKLAMMPRKPSDLKPAAEPASCERIRELNKRLQAAQWEFDDFQERARKLGIPWNWIE